MIIAETSNGIPKRPTNGLSKGAVNKVAYSVTRGTRGALNLLLKLAKAHLSEESLQFLLNNDVVFQTSKPELPAFPCPLKQTEAIAALKAVEASVAASIANLRYGAKQRRLVVDVDSSSCFLFSTYLATVAGTYLLFLAYGCFLSDLT
jgi:hypothetical protein